LIVWYDPATLKVKFYATDDSLTDLSSLWDSPRAKELHSKVVPEPIGNRSILQHKVVNGALEPLPDMPKERQIGKSKVIFIQRFG
jgi:hypothetical protein